MILRVTVAAAARKESIQRRENGSFAISVRQAAERNAANERVLELLALHLGIPRKKLRIRTGHRSPSKRIERLD